jgi:hypothetical protein
MALDAIEMEELEVLRCAIRSRLILRINTNITGVPSRAQASRRAGDLCWKGYSRWLRSPANLASFDLSWILPTKGHEALQTKKNAQQRGVPGTCTLRNSTALSEQPTLVWSCERAERVRCIDGWQTGM